MRYNHFFAVLLSRTFTQEFVYLLHSYNANSDYYF